MDVRFCVSSLSHARAFQSSSSDACMLCADKELTDQDGEQLPYSRLADAVVAIPGVVTTGLLLGPCCPSAVLIVNPAARPELLRRL